MSKSSKSSESSKNSETMRLDKYLANSGAGTRSELKKILRQGRVSVDGLVEKDGAKKVVPGENEVLLDGAPIIYTKHVYLLMNKPQGVISATEDNYHQTVSDLLDESLAHFDVFPVGRLDIDTTGLLILTNDGDFAHRLISPKKQVPKMYQAELEFPAEEGYIPKFREGVTLKNGYKCLPAKIEIDESNPCHVEITVVEGKFHQVKKMVEAMGNKVQNLHRKSIGALVLDETDLPPGTYRELYENELELLFQDTTLE